MTFVFSRHALARIQQGDENGLRTVLTPDKISEILTSEIVVPYKASYVFYSVEDAKCLQAIVASDSNTVISVVPTDRLDFWVRLLAERKALGEDFFLTEVPVVKSFGKQASTLIGCNVETFFDRGWFFHHEEVFFSRLDSAGKMGILFRTKEFHLQILEALERCSERVRRPLKISNLFARGYGWQTRLPVFAPYDFLGIEPQTRWGAI